MKLIRKVVPVGVMCLVLAGVAGQAAQGQQRTISLFSSSCVQRGSMGSSGRDVSIGKESFTEIFYMYNNDTLITCRIKPADSQARYKTLRLGFGIADEQSFYKPITINVYLDGNLVESRTLSPGEKSLLLLDVSRISSVAIEVPDNNNKYQTVSFVQALLEPISSSPGQRQ